MIRKILKTIDLVGPKITFEVNKNTRLKTEIGGILTLILIIISIAAFIGFGRDIFTRIDPQVTINRVENDNPTYTLTDQNFLFAIYDQYSDLPFAEFEKKFVPSMDYGKFYGNGSVYIKTFPMEKCSNEALKKWNGTFFNKPDNYYCLPKNTTLKIQGVYQQGEHNTVRLQVNYCQNTTGGIPTNKCYSRSFIEQNITGRIQMHYIFTTAKIDINQYKNPGTYVPYAGLTNTNTNSWARLNVFFTNIFVQTDTGFFFSDQNIDKYDKIESIVSESIYSVGTDTIFSHVMGNSRYKEVYSRTYIKVQNVIALMGGFVNAAYIILEIFAIYISKPVLVDIFNKLYKFKYVLDIKDLKNNYNSSPKRLSTNIQGSYIKKDTEQIHDGTTANINNYNNNFILGKNIGNTIENNQYNNILQIYEYKKNRNYILRKGIIFKIFRCCINKKINLYREIEKKMIKVFSIENYTKLSRNVKIMQILCLENYHYNLLKVCQTPKRNSSQIFNDVRNLEVALHNENEKLSKKTYDIILNKFGH